MEDLLDALYDNERPATPALTSLLLAATEQLEQLVSGTPPSELAHSLETTYRQFDSYSLPIVQAGGVVDAIGADGHAATRRSGASGDGLGRADRRCHRARLDRRCVGRRRRGRGRSEDGGLAHRCRRPLIGVDLDADGAEPEEAEAIPASTAANDAAMADAAAAAGARQFVRVPLAKLDGVSKLMGELVISRTALEQRVAQLELQITELHHSTSRLRRASGQIQLEDETTALLRGTGSTRPPAPTAVSCRQRAR